MVGPHDHHAVNRGAGIGRGLSVMPARAARKPRHGCCDGQLARRRTDSPPSSGAAVLADAGDRLGARVVALAGEVAAARGDQKTLAHVGPEAVGQDGVVLDAYQGRVWVAPGLTAGRVRWWRRGCRPGSGRRRSGDRCRQDAPFRHGTDALAARPVLRTPPVRSRRPERLPRRRCARRRGPVCIYRKLARRAFCWRAGCTSCASRRRRTASK